MIGIVKIHVERIVEDSLRFIKSNSMLGKNLPEPLLYPTQKSQTVS